MLAGAILALLSLTAVGSLDQAQIRTKNYSDVAWPDHAWPRQIVPARGDLALKPPSLPPGWKMWQIRVSARRGEDASPLALKLPAGLTQPWFFRGRRAYFKVKTTDLASPELIVHNQGPRPVKIDEIQARNYAYVTPAYLITFSRPAFGWPSLSQKIGWLGLALMWQLLTIWPLPTSHRGTFQPWRPCLLVAGPGLVLAIFLILGLFGPCLMLTRIGFFILAACGPFLMFLTGRRLAPEDSVDRKAWVRAAILVMVMLLSLIVSLVYPDLIQSPMQVAVLIGSWLIVILLAWAWLKPRPSPGVRYAAALVICLLISTLTVLHETGYRLRPANDFISFGREFAKDESLLPPKASLLEYGYDGQFFFYAAQDPLARGKGPRNMDSPAYRYQRPFFPLVLWLISGGDNHRLAEIMIGFNLAAVLASFALLYHLSLRWQGRGDLAYLFLCYAGYSLPILMGVAEPLANLLLLAGVVLLTRGWILAAAAAFTCLVLTKEYYIFVPGVAGLYALIKRRPWWPAHLIPLTAILAWQYYIFHQFHTWPFQESNRNIAWPFIQMFDLLTPPTNWHGVLFVLGVLAVGAMAIQHIRRHPDQIEGWLLAGALILPIIGGEAIWESFRSYLRVFSPVYTCYLLVLLRAPSRANLIPAGFFTLSTLGAVTRWF